MNPTRHATPGARRGKLAVGIAVGLSLAASVGLQFVQPQPDPAGADRFGCTEPSTRAI